jgi:NAD-dependent deacetylase
VGVKRTAWHPVRVQPDEQPPDGIDAEGWRLARRLLRTARTVAVLTGAGISTDSGIADFRGPQGVWTKDPEAEKLSTIDHYLSSTEIRAKAWQNRLRSPVWRAEPNPGHHALVELERSGRLHTLVTQNIDGLHLIAGNDRSAVVEVHGNARTVRCWTCGLEWPIDDALARVEAGEDDPACEPCGGILKTTTVLFGEDLPPGAIERAFRAAEDADVLLTVGTTLAVMPVNRMVLVAKRAGTPVVILNGSQTELDWAATVALRGSISEVLPSLLAP